MRPREILVRRQGLPARSLFAVALASAWVACAHEASRADAGAASASADAGIRVARGRRRRGRGVRVAALARTVAPSGSARPGASSGSAGAAQTFAEPGGDPGAASANDLALGNDPGGDDDPPTAADPPRPRMTETGPVLTQDVGSPAHVSFDMASGATNGPMGLDPSQISHGLDPLLPRLQNCAAATSAPHGHVGVRIRIRSDGTPTAARVTGGGGVVEFVTCVRRVVASAHFERFQGPDTFATWGFDVD